MLKVYLGSCDNEIYNPPVYFINQYEDKWLITDLAKEMIKEYLIKAGRINISTVQELCGFSHKQARAVLHKMQAEEIIVIGAKGKYAYYILKQGV